jgi:hypothetical protein
MTVVDTAAARNGSPQRTGAPDLTSLVDRGATRSPDNTNRHGASNSADHSGLAGLARPWPWNARPGGTQTIDDARRNAVRFFWAWLLLATGVSIGGNFLHAWLTAPPGMRIWAAVAAIVTPTILLGATHSVALLIKTRRRDGWTVVDAIVLGATLLLTFAVAGCAFTMSFFSLRDLMVMLGINALGAKLWPIAVDLSIVNSTLALLALTSPRSPQQPPHGAGGLEAMSGWSTLATQRRLRLESAAARVKERNADVPEIAELTIAQTADILERLYDKREPQRVVGAAAKLDHRHIRKIKTSANEFLSVES